MEQREGSFRSFDGIDLYYLSILPDGTPRANIAYVHGFGDHVMRHLSLAEQCAKEGYAFFGLDLRGHGRSPGQRGFVASWDDYLADVAGLIALAAKGHPPLPTFLVGHSVGGVIAIDYAIRHGEELSGLIATAPELGTLPVAPAVVLIGRILSRAWPRFSLSTPLDLDALSRNTSMVEETRRDPLYHNKGTARLGTELQEAMDWVHAHAGQLRVPFLVLQGGADRIAQPEATKRFFELAGSLDKELLFYENAYHELDRDTGTNRLFGDLFEWLDRHARERAAESRQ